jgi:hypothetical protein
MSYLEGDSLLKEIEKSIEQDGNLMDEDDEDVEDPEHIMMMDEDEDDNEDLEEDIDIDDDVLIDGPSANGMDGGTDTEAEGVNFSKIGGISAM